MDYAMFASASVAVLAGLSMWMWYRRRGDRTLLVAGALLGAILIPGYFFTDYSGELERDRLRSRIEGLAPTYADELQRMGHRNINPSTPAADPVYLAMIEKQIRWLQLNRAVADIYTFRKHPDGLQLLVDSETDYDYNGEYEGDRESRTQIGEIWELVSPYVDRAFNGETTFHDQPYSDRWGTWVSAYAPMYDEAGNVEAVLGTDYPAEEWVASIRQARGGAIGVLAVMVILVLASATIIMILRTHIDFRKRAERQQRDNAQKTRQIIDTARDAFVAMDADGAITDWNPQAETIFGWPREQAIGRKLVDTFIPPEFRAGHVEGLNRFLQTGEGRILDQRLELTALHQSGETFPVELSITANRMGDEYLFHAFLHDISQRKQAEQELRQAKEDAEQATIAKSQFLANMSHEIRTPMNGIIGMAALLSQSQLSGDQRNSLEMVQQSAQSLLRLLNDILDFSKIEAGKMELDTAPFNLRDCVGIALQTLGVQAADKGLELAYRVAPDVPETLKGDDMRIRQMIMNLAGNAIKFTDAGEVVINVEMSNDEPLLDKPASHGDSTHGVAALHFSVRDTGIGISADKQAGIFEAFRQADSTTTRRFGGTGLGLAITSQLVELMQGNIWVDSTVGEGTVFHFTLHLDRTGEIEQTQEQPAVLAGLPVLIVDDNASCRDILEETVRAWGMNATTAVDGKTCLAAMRQAAHADNPYRLVLLDRDMASMDGFETARQIRQDPNLHDCRIIVTTPAVRSGDAERSRELNIDATLSKPVVYSILRDTMVGLFVRVQDIETSGMSVSDILSVDGHPLRHILLVEDGLINQRVAVGLLEKRGHHVTIANNGLEAIAAIAEQTFDLVLMDLQMPEMDGIQATAHIRERERHGVGHVPIIAMTASAMKGDRERCLQSGMDGYIAKPFDPDQLYRLVEGYPAARAS